MRDRVPAGGNSPQEQRYDAKRQICQQINGREYAAAALGGDSAVDQRHAAKEKQAVADAAHCRRGEENPQLVPGDGKGEQSHAAAEAIAPRTIAGRGLRSRATIPEHGGDCEE